ncbi:MAG: 30S ribosomal protein S8 [Acidobacteriota bacterium]|nr:MAG: 30S ribosomal protein S8 [Acidobacteriota bacterium]
MLTDPIADMLTRIRNALAVRHHDVEVPASRLKMAVLRVLKDEGYIEDFEEGHSQAESRSGKSPKRILKVHLKYEGDTSVIRNLRKVSRSGRRVYCSARNLAQIQSGLGISIVSTSRGVMTDRDCRRRSLGGEILCEVW